MNATTELVLGMFLLVGCSVLVGELFARMGQAALVGQLLVGIILGPTFLAGYLGFDSLSAEFSALQFLATFFILMMAGLSITPQQIRATGVAATLLGIAIFIIPFLLGAGLVRVLYPDLPPIEDLFIALTISITALPVLGIMLRDLGLLDSKFGTFLMSSAMVNELAAITTFAVLLQIYANPNAVGFAIATSVVTVAMFLTSILAVYFAVQALRQRRVWERWAERFRTTWRTREAGFAILMVFGLGAALYSQALGLTYLVGAFYCGILITPDTAGRREHRSITYIFEAITWGFFIPLFFALVGFNMNLRDIGLAAVPILAFLGLAFFAIFSKLFVGSAVSKSLGWSSDESLAAGFLVVSRGAVELAIALLLLEEGIFSTAIFTVVAGVGLVTTFVAPIGARPFVRVLLGRPPPPTLTGADTSLPSVGTVRR